jgi:subtilisin family serine protease
VVTVPDDALEVIVGKLLSDPEVDWIQANRAQVVHSTAAPLGLNGTSAQHLMHHVEGAWDHTRGSGARIGILDTGFAFSFSLGQWHRDGQTVGSYGVDKLGFVDDIGSCNSQQQQLGACDAADDTGHGTAMVGLVGANDNDWDEVGIAPFAKTYSMKVGFNAARSPCGFTIFEGDQCFEDDDWVAGIDWAIVNNLDVLSMSFVANPGGSVEAALLAAYFTHDILLVAAVGNHSGHTDELVKLSWVMGVGAAKSDTAFTYAAHPSRVEVVGRDGFETLNALCAVGSNCWWDPVNPTTVTGGTSAATANVAAVAGLVAAAHPTWTAGEIRARLIESASGAVLPVADAEWAIEGHDRLRVGVQGPQEIFVSGDYTWTATAPQGGAGGTILYRWEYREQIGGSGWRHVGSSSSYLRGIPESAVDFELRLTIQEDGRRARVNVPVDVQIDCEDKGGEGDGCNH